MIRKVVLIFGGVFALLAVAQLFQSEPVAALVLGLPAGYAIYWGSRNPGAAALSTADIERIATEAAGFIATVNSAGGFEAVRGSRVVSGPDDPLLLVAPAKLHELVRITDRGYVGTRVMIAGMPLYLGKSSPMTRQEMRQAAEGEAGLTASRLLFTAAGRSADVKLSRIMGVELHRDGLTLNVSGRVKPMYLVLENPILWAQMIKNLQVVKLSGTRLVNGHRLTVM